MKNPSAVYCEEMGYEYIIENTPEGQIGTCKFLDETTADGWDFYQGKDAEEYSYCVKQGYEQIISNDPEICGYPGECTVCLFKNGTEVELSELMNLDFSEEICGDGLCVLGEDYSTCPEDCPSGSLDYYCDGVKDEICDPDCIEEEDVDCKEDGTKKVNNILLDIREKILILIEENKKMIFFVISGIVFLVIIIVSLSSKRIKLDKPKKIE